MCQLRCWAIFPLKIHRIIVQGQNQPAWFDYLLSKECLLALDLYVHNLLCWIRSLLEQFAWRVLKLWALGVLHFFLGIFACHHRCIAQIPSKLRRKISQHQETNRCSDALLYWELRTPNWEVCQDLTISLFFGQCTSLQRQLFSHPLACNSLHRL